MRLVRLERQQSRVADDIRAALASLGRGSTVIGGIALIGVGSVTDRPIEAVVILPHGVIIVIGVDLPDPALRLEAPLGASWVADGWPLVADDDAVNPATEALDLSQACERKIAALVPGTAPVGTIIAVGPYVETVDQPAGDLAGPVRVLHPTPTTMLAATVSLATAHRPRSVDQVRALIRGLAPDAPEFSDDILVGEGFSRFTDDAPPESLWDSGPEVPMQAASSVAGVSTGSAAASGAAGAEPVSGWRTETPVPPAPVVAEELVAEAEPSAAPAAAEPPAGPELPAAPETTPTGPTPAQPPAETTPTEAGPRLKLPFASETTAAEATPAPEPPAAPAEPTAGGPTHVSAAEPVAKAEPETPAAAEPPTQPGPEPKLTAAPETTSARPAASSKAAPGPKLPLASEITLTAVSSPPETAPAEAERTEVLPHPAPPVFPGTEAPQPEPSTPDTERTETLTPDTERTERVPAGPRPERTPPPPQPRPAARQPIEPSAPQPFPRPRPEPEDTSRTVRWLPLGAIGLLILLVVAAIAVATTGDDTAAAPTGPPTPATQPPPASPSSAAPAPSLQFALRAADGDQRCASHAFGDAQASLQQTSCSGVRRASYAATVDGRPGAVTVGIVEFPDASQAAAFKAIADTPGGGGILDLATETGKWGDTAPPRFENAAYASKVEGTSVRLVQAVWAPGPSTPDDPGLARAAKAALDLPAQ
ncbi:hypothetical protein [Amycolatopsis lexingtonensis]|uniref:hypothetical protein n=1 Tax=Amycolatopsis lexingtonensis TaxID=218822 RepID=UPI003F6E8AC6